MPEEQRVAVDEVRLDGFLVEVPLLAVGHQDHDQVGFLAGFVWRHDAQALVLGLCPGSRLFGEADANVDTGVAQGQCVGVALAAVSEDGNAAGLDDGQIGVVVVMDLGGHEISSRGTG